MGDISYRPLIEKMKWSYSRINCFKDCPYAFFLKYIEEHKEKDMFYASYGSFIHKLIERHYKEGLPREDMLLDFLCDFQSKVKGKRPKRSTVTSFIQKGSEYLGNFEEFPFTPVATETEVEFEIDGKKFIGIIDYLGLTEDGEYVIVDNKSRNLSPRSKRKTPTVKDKELDDMLRQLYLYSDGVYQMYGKYPAYLCFNCFKNGVFIKEEFDIEKYEEAKQWAREEIQKAIEEEDFFPSYDYFYCNWLCGMQDYCYFYQDIKEEERRFR